MADADYILDLIPFLQDTFEKVDAVSVGLSNTDLSLGSDVSEVQVFLSEEPFQVVFGGIVISDNPIDRDGFDSMIKEEETITDMIIGGMRSGKDVDIQNPKITITYPDIGDSATYGEGLLIGDDSIVGYELILFRVERVFVLLYSGYHSLERESLLPIASGIELRINKLSE